LRAVAGTVGTDAWFYLVATTGLVTMLVGAVVACSATS